MKTIGIYAIVHRASGRRYIGSSVDVERRLCQHKTALNQGRHYNIFLQRAWMKHGAHEFDFVTMEIVSAAVDLPAREQYHVDAYRPDVYNIGTDTRVPWRGRVRTADHRAKLAAAHLGKSQPYTPIQRAKILAANAKRTGSKHSDETKRKMSERKLGVKRRPFLAATIARMREAALKREAARRLLRSVA